VRALFFSLFILFYSGCTVVGAGVATVAGGSYYITGEIVKAYPVSIYHLYEVTLYSFQQEGIKLVSKTNTYEEAEIIGELHTGESVTVKIFYNKEGLARLGIRIGTFGDEKRSRDMLKCMERYI
jgi:hypothetical protein